MLCFVFSILVIVLDQLFKRWAVIALSGGGDITIIPGVIGLTYIENTGAFWGMLSNFRFVLIAVSLLCAVLLVFILLRYDGGFWGRLGMAAVLGGAVGNLLDRVFRQGGAVIDMFEFKFMSFAIFNIADIFITLGGITFLVYYIISSVKEERQAKQVPDTPAVPRIVPKPEQNQGFTAAPKNTQLEDPPPFRKQQEDLPPKTELDSYEEHLRGLTDVLEEFDLDKIMSEYGLNDDKD